MHKYRRETNYTNLLMEMFIHIVGMYVYQFSNNI